VLLLSWASIAVAAGQGSAPRNDFLPADDVALGTEAAAAVQANVALVKDEEINASSPASAAALSMPFPTRCGSRHSGIRSKSSTRCPWRSMACRADGV
jgi:hypothetical protein